MTAPRGGFPSVSLHFGGGGELGGGGYNPLLTDANIYYCHMRLTTYRIVELFAHSLTYSLTTCFILC